ncbi:DNA/RNA non-specific endonuclease [Fibrella aquatilis]|uniref:DNA/RNA non-specific endonuclease n=1 Tax=Fibrella aquatilis TaxID=2817059 RepID=A0A939G7A8_9BACT|nr:DNA/RNA non-specific endonuclease [Fibrella aquatilis]MBO0932533.1 DNA/RNA non-specific endonuclease [Fibrella aquatilis]
MTYPDTIAADTWTISPPTLDTIIPYNPNFIGKRTIPLPDLTDQLSTGDVLDGRVFDYIYYSLIMDERRAMPLYTAYNIDRERMIHVPRQADHWVVDPRIPAGLQTDETLYEGNDWDRGHMVPRRAVAWGDSATATAAAQGVFYYSNTVPQHRIFNQRNWNDLENFVLQKLRPDSKRLSVFAGPVSRLTDIEYRGRRVPHSFWMITVVSDETNPRNFFVHAYLMDQYALTASGTFTPTQPIQQFDPSAHGVSVAQVEAVTPLKFGSLR